jgi:hypothetical protein
MKSIRIFLLALIVIALGLLFTKNIWVPKLVDRIIEREFPTQSLGADGKSLPATVINATTTVTVANDPFFLPPQEKIFVDPGEKYRLIVPDGMVYRYTPPYTEREYGELSLWSGQGWALRKKILEEEKYIEGGSSFSIEFFDDEYWNQSGHPKLTKEEIAREKTVKGKNVTIYAPYITFAGHEEARIPVRGGALQVAHPYFGDDSTLWFDKVLQGIEVIE